MKWRAERTTSGQEAPQSGVFRQLPALRSADAEPGVFRSLSEDGPPTTTTTTTIYIRPSEETTRIETRVVTRHRSSSASSAPGGDSEQRSVAGSSAVSESVSGMRADTGQEQQQRTRGASPPSRASSPGTSSSGSGYSLAAGPMGSTTGLLPLADDASNKLKVDEGCMPGLSATLTILSLAASLGNVLRLPRVVYLSGGGTFLIVYICISLVFGIPLVFLEIGLGQFCQEGTTKLWRAVPLFKGVGYVKVLASSLLSVYYPVLMGLSLFYMVWCAKGPLPFSECTQPFTPKTGEECLKQTFLTPVNEDAMWFGVSAAFLFLLWALFMLCVFKGEHSYRTSVYFILAPVLVCLVALLIQALLSDTSATGLGSLVTFNWDNLLDIKVWYFATVQMFFSTHLGFGNIVTCAGRLYSKNNALWTAVSYVVCNLVIGVLSVCVVYQWSALRPAGNDTVFPEALPYTLTYDASLRMGQLKQLWAALAFLAFICAGFAAMVAVLYTVLVAFTLEINKQWDWWVGAACACVIGFLIGILCIVPHNMEIIHILDHYVIGRMVIVSTALELIAFAWIYGSNTLYNDFEFVLGCKLNPIWKLIWLITPFLLVVVEVWSLVSLPLTGLSSTVSDPEWVYITGWVLYLFTWVIILWAGVLQIRSQVDYNLSQKFLSTLKPSRNWGPVDTIYRHWWVQWRVTCNKTGQRDFTFKRRGTKDYTSSIQKYQSTEPVGTYRSAPSPANGTLQHNRATDRGPFTIQGNGNLPEHVCWRGTLQRGNNST
ncbi:sodium- and chloride-dependent neutral and basic amino acid transporter B(0+) [Periplaneta americana]|uniref:sodium- and chloride-dependent neutral and basic amino acid transporter B(0+) n=1 Tax=Periplaneta americana TaxID=6978 RepID=UPI0037E91420